MPMAIQLTLVDKKVGHEVQMFNCVSTPYWE